MRLKRFILDLLLLTWFAFFALVSFYFYSLHFVKIQENQIFLIDKNTSLSQVSDKLFQDKIISSNRVFFLFSLGYSKILNKKIQSGEYSSKGLSNLIDLLDLITSGKVIQHKFIVPEGITLDKVLTKLSKLDNIVQIPDKLGKIPEGSLLPATYYYTRGTAFITIITRMQKELKIFLDKAWLQRDKLIDEIIKSPEEVIILASIIEKETYLESEKKLMAGVYLNRLKNNMRLQADPTLAYILRDEDPTWNGRVLYSHLKRVSPYNTYLNYGLPPTAICNPGKKSILAVLQPQWTGKFFFFAGKDGKHIFSTTFAEHKAKRQKK